jgi:hypothetical protein
MQRMTDIVHSPALDLVLLTGYIVAFIALNLVAYLIASFYCKKFEEPAPRGGFLAAIILMLLYGGSLYVGWSSRAMGAVINVLLLFSGSIASAATAASLYYIMRKVRK